MYQKILVAVDGSQSSRRAVEEAVRIAQLTHAHVRNVYVLDWAPVFPYTCHYDMAKLEEAFNRQGHESLDEAARVLTGAGVDTDSELVKTQSMTEDVAARLQRYVAHYQPDLVVMGTHGYRGARRAILGSVAERFLRFSTCPVILACEARRNPGHPVVSERVRETT
ncbi:universal stress protein [Paraburkholderia oxyphila]|uniref:universal stress protein n=1 Tax=Paraburkholderia oxyphila TaxID=614212 RepID=UPI0007C5C2CA|nr:universal stress protein [Paraburkholderia oxyphila]